MSKNSSCQQNWGLAIAILLLTILPLIFVRGEYGGADSQAQQTIRQLQPEYQPWFKSLLEPASSEIQSLLFAAQAALGAGVMGYVIGRYQGRMAKEPVQPQTDLMPSDHPSQPLE